MFTASTHENCTAVAYFPRFPGILTLESRKTVVTYRFFSEYTIPQCNDHKYYNQINLLLCRVISSIVYFCVLFKSLPIFLSFLGLSTVKKSQIIYVANFMMETKYTLRYSLCVFSELEIP